MELVIRQLSPDERSYAVDSLCDEEIIGALLRAFVGKFGQKPQTAFEEAYLYESFYFLYGLDSAPDGDLLWFIRSPEWTVTVKEHWDGKHLRYDCKLAEEAGE